MKSKKGISPLIATVLIIGFTIVLGALVITWGTKFFRTTVEDTEKSAAFSLACTSLNFEGTAKINANSLEVTLSNSNERTIEGFYFVAKGGSTPGTDTYSTDPSLITGSGIITPTTALTAFETSKLYTLTIVTTGRDELDIRPIIKDNAGKNKVCESKVTIPIVA